MPDGSSTPEALSRLLSALHGAVPDLDGTALAEALWLAARMTEDTEAGPSTSSAADMPGTDAGTDRPATSDPRPPVPEPADPETPDGEHEPARSSAPARPLHERLPGSGTTVRGHPVAAPRAAVLPRALELTRALRPWKRPWPEGRRAELDMDATVDGYARSGELIPVFAAAPERWFDLALVVDRSPSMRVWHETITEFTTVLDRLGAFRTLQVADLTFDAGLRPHTPGQLRSADGRRLVVVVSDCAAEAWRRPQVWQLLRDWAGATPTAVLNPLPTKLWRRGGLNLPTVRFTPAAPGATRSRVPHEPPPLLDTTSGPDDDPWLPVPVLSLTPHSLGRWSRTLMRGDPEGCTAVLVPPTGRLPGPPRPRGVPLPPGTRAKGFLRTAAPRAARLAVLCSPFDRLSLRLLHVIRQELVPDATTADVAEVVTSGVFLLEPDDDGPVSLLLPPDAQTVLREQLPAHEAWEIHRAVSRHVASRGDGRAQLPSVAHDRDGTRELPGEREAFAEASRRTLELLGLAGEGETAEPRADGLPPAPRLFGRHAVVARNVCERITSEPSTRLVLVTGVDGTPGMGRTAVALHVAHQVREHFPDGQFYVDLRGSRRAPVPPDAALYGLLRDLGVPADEIPRDMEELADALHSALRGRRVLLVVDDASTPELIRCFRTPPPEGCAVVVTTRTLPDDPSPYAPVVGLSTLAEDDALAMLEALVDREAQKRHGLRLLVTTYTGVPLTLRLLGSWVNSPHPPPPLLPSASPYSWDSFLGLRLSFLPGRVTTALHQLAMAETGEFSLPEAVAFLATRERAAPWLLDELVGEGLLERRGRHTYGFHGAVHSHLRDAMGYAAEEDGAVERGLDLYHSAAAGMYESGRPGTAFVEHLGVPRLSAPLPDGWIPRALALVNSTGPLDIRASLLFLLQDAGATWPYRSSYERVALEFIAKKAESPVAHAWGVAALAHAQYAAGRADDAWHTLGRVPRSGLDRLDGPIRSANALLYGRLMSARGLLDSASVELRLARLLFHEEKDRNGEATASLALARLLLRRGQAEEAAPLAERAAQLFEGLGLTAEAGYALRCLPGTAPAAERPAPRTQPPPRTIIAIETATHTSDPQVLQTVVRTLLSGEAVTDRNQLKAHTSYDSCLLFVDPDVPLGPLLAELAERLPAELEADGEPSTLRLAVHTGPVDLRSDDMPAELGVEYTHAMLRSAEFRRVSENYPDHPTLCVSPEVREALDADGSLQRRFVPHEVTTEAGTVVCVVLTPRVDGYAYDAELLRLARAFNELDPDGHRMARALRDCFDTVLDMEHTGRYDLRRLRGRERALTAQELERSLRREFHFGAGGPTDLVWEPPGRQSPIPFDLKLSLTGPNWLFPPPAEGAAVCLVVHADDRDGRWSAGLVRVRPETLTDARNREGAARLTPAARRSVLWLRRDAPLPENVLLHLDESARQAILAPKSAVQRTAEFFRRVQGRPVPTSALRPLMHGREQGRRMRDALDVLRAEGVLVVWGNPWGRAVAEALQLPRPAEDELLSVRLVAYRPDHADRPTVAIGAGTWVVAAPEDPVEPFAEDFPAPSWPW